MKHAVPLLALLAQAWVSITLAAAADTTRPNFVFILMDDMGYADIGPFGARDIRTPGLDRMAKEGVKLTDHYSNGPVCTPTRAGFITGRYQQRVGLEWAILPVQKKFGLTASAPSIARALKDRGYATAIFGKWHLGSAPEFAPKRHGFDESLAITGGNADMYSHRNILDEQVLFDERGPATAEGYLTDAFNDRSVAFIEKNQARPFFLYLAFNAVHWPFQAPGRPDQRRSKETWYDGTRADYARMLERADDGIARILATLDRLGLARNTLVVFSSDNGGERLSDNGKLRDKKGTLWEGGIRVASLAWWPGKLPAGTTSAAPSITMDWTVTFAELAGANLQAPLDGVNLLPQLTRSVGANAERTFFWRKQREGILQKAARRGSWKYVRDGAREYLFDLSRDVSESHDLAAEKPEIVRQLREAVAAWEKDVDGDAPAERVL